MYKRGRINRSDVARRTALRPFDNLQIARSNVLKKAGTSKKIVSNTVRPQKPLPLYPVIKFEKFESLTGTYKHSGDLGDLWYSLPVIRHLGGGTLYLNPNGLKGFKPDGTPSGLNHSSIAMAIPLLEAQPYVSSVKFWTDETYAAVDIDYFRQVNFRSDNLCNKILSAFGVPFTETNKPWIQCDPKPIAKTVFCRSFRYRNPTTKYKDLLRKYGRSAVFMGLPEEHKDFEHQFGKIDFYPVKDFLEMAQVINGAELFIGNQSSPMALAIAMHKPFIQEAFSKGSDCRFPLKTARYM